MYRILIATSCLAEFTLLTLHKAVGTLSLMNIIKVVTVGIIVIGLVFMLRPIYKYDILAKGILQDEVKTFSMPAEFKKVKSNYLPGHCFDNCPETRIYYTIPSEDYQQTATSQVVALLTKSGYTLLHNIEYRASSGSNIKTHSVSANKQTDSGTFNAYFDTYPDTSHPENNTYNNLRTVNFRLTFVFR